MKTYLAALIFSFTSSGICSAEEGDFVVHLRKALPDGWNCKLESSNGDSYINVTTTEIDTVASKYGNAAPGTKFQKLKIRFKLLPLYSAAMLKHIQVHNAPLKKKLKSLNYYSSEYREVSRQLIDVPAFQDSVYGIRVEYLSRVPKNAEQKKQFQEFLAKISKDWKSVGTDSKPVDELVRILTR